MLNSSENYHIPDTTQHIRDTMNLHQNNVELAIQHMQRFYRAAILYKTSPIQQLCDEAARTMRVESKLLHQLTTTTTNSTLQWAADETDIIMSQLNIPQPK